MLAELKDARFGKRMKVESVDQKRLRDRVRNGVDRTIDVIRTYHPTAGSHLDGAILRGSVMTYAPGEVPEWEF